MQRHMPRAHERDKPPASTLGETHKVTVLLPVDIHTAANRLATARGMKLGAFMRLLVEQELSKESI